MNIYKHIPKWSLRLLVAVVLIANIIGVIWPGTASADSWYNASWLYRKKITLNAASGAASLSNFPVLINITSDGNLGAHAQLSGNDVLFTAADKTTKLDHEIEKYTSNGATANLTAWVRIPTLSNSTTTDIYIYYGNAGASNQQNATGVWDSNFRMVQHMEEAAGGTNAVTDSTSNAFNGTDYNAPTFGVVGKIDGAIKLVKASDQYVQLPSSNSIISSSNFMIESWIITTTNHPIYGSGAMEGRIVNLHRGATAGSAASLYVAQNVVALFYYDTVGLSHYLTYTANYYDGVPHHLAATYTTADGIFRLYYDGVQVATAAVSGSFIGFGSYPAMIGTHDGTVRDFDGTIDEARISNDTRSAGWIQTSYNNQNSPSTFYTLGPEESPVVAPTVTTNAASTVEETSAALSGNITATGGENNTDRGFQWSTDAGFGTSSNWTESGSYTTGAFSYALPAATLNQGTLYYYRAISKNTSGWGYGGSQSFLTKPEAPSAFTATPAGAYQINLSWTKGTGADRTMVRGKLGSYPSSVSDGYQVYFNTGTSASDAGLTPSTTYYYRAWSEVTNGSQQWSDAYLQSFAATDAAAGLPSVTTNAATGIDETIANISGTLTNNGGEDCNWTLQWGTSTGSYTANTSWSGSTITTGVTFSHSFAGLLRGTKYYYRAGVQNSAGTVFGAEQEFLTKPAVPSAFTATVISPTQVDLAWTPGDGAGRTMIRVRTDAYPTDYNDGSEAYFSSGSSVSLTGLTPGVTYYYRAWSEKTGSQQFSNTFVQLTVTMSGPPPGPSIIGGKVFTVNKARLLAPWLVMSAVLCLLIVILATHIVKRYYANPGSGLIFKHFKFLTGNRSAFRQKPAKNQFRE